VGRAGIEPATLGLKVRPSKLRRLALRGKCLQSAHSSLATRHHKVRPLEASSYAHGTRTRARSSAFFGNGQAVASPVAPRPPHSDPEGRRARETAGER
jgi:hypothetical protein